MTAGVALSETAVDKMRNLYKSKDFEQAAQFIPDAVKESPKDIDVFVQAGDIYFELDKIDSALIFYRKANDIRSKQPTVLRKIGKTLSLKGNHQEAIKQLKALVDIDGKDAYNLLALGQAYINADSLRPAELYITKARELNKKIPDAYVVLGDLYFAQGVYELARTNYEEAIAIDDNLAEARVKLATAYYKLATRESDENLRQELFNRSLKEWNIITQKDPKNAKAFYEQGKLLYFAKDYANSIPSFYQYLKLRPSGSLGRWYLAQSLYEIGKCDSAAPQLKIVSQELDSVKDKATLKLAQCYFEQKQFKESIEIYKGIKASGKLENADLERMAAATFRGGDTLSAIQLYKELINNDPKKCGTMIQLGTLALIMKKYDESLYFFLKHVANCTDSVSTPKALYYIGYDYFNMQKPDSAIIYINKSIEKDPKNLSYQILLGDVHSSMKQTDTAMIIFKDVVTKGMADTAKYAKELNMAFSKLAGLYINEKQFTELNKMAKDWTEFDSKSEYAWLFYAVSFQGKSDIENAIKNYKKVLQINPKNGPAKDNLKKLEEVQKQNSNK